MLKLLLVDDQPRELDGMKGMLKWETMGIEVVGAVTDGRQALALADQMPIDIVITDVIMPDMDGIALIRELQKRHPHIKSICISGFDEYKFVSMAINSGASGYVLKPVLISEIQAVLDRILSDIRKERQQTSALDVALAYLCANARGWDAALSPDMRETSVLVGVGALPPDARPLAAIALSDGRSAYLLGAGTPPPAGAALEGPLPLREAQAPLLRLIADTPPMSRGAERSAVETIRQNIHEHLSETIDDEILLSGVFLSRSYASVLFKNETGMTIHRYIMQERLKRAMELLLEEPDTKVTSIAQQCGFSDASHLTNSMQKQFGITPERYRRRNTKP